MAIERRTCFAAIAGIIVWPLRALAALTDSEAMAKAGRDFGARAMIAQFRRIGDAYSTKAVGYWNDFNFVELGRGQETWDSAFANVVAGAQVQAPNRQSIRLGRINIEYDMVERNLIEQQLIRESGGDSIAIDPAVAAYIRDQCEERLANLIQQMLVRYPNEVGSMMQVLGITLTNATVGR
jgi:hypothetical protein